MNTKNKVPYIILVTFVTTHINSMEQPIVVACNFDVISKNVDTSSLIGNAVLCAGQILRCFSWSSIFHITSITEYMRKRGTELAVTNPGITNTIKQLFTELEKQQYGKFTDTAVSWFIEMGINPVPNHEAVSLLKKVKRFGIPTIGAGIQDSLEHEIYARKMLTEQNIDIQTLYDGIITIPTLEEQTAFNFTPEDCLAHPSNPQWLIARKAAPSSSFTHAIQVLAQNLRPNPSIWSINSKEELALVVNALRDVYEQQPQSPEQGKRFNEIMLQNRAISPTKV